MFAIMVARRKALFFALTYAYTTTFIYVVAAGFADNELFVVSFRTLIIGLYACILLAITLAYLVSYFKIVKSTKSRFASKSANICQGIERRLKSGKEVGHQYNDLLDLCFQVAPVMGVPTVNKILLKKYVRIRLDYPFPSNDGATWSTVEMKLIRGNEVVATRDLW